MDLADGARPLVAALHQRFVSEWFHEATHWNLVPDRRWNDRLGDVLLGLLFGARLATNRVGHFEHHDQPDFFHPDDPDTAAAVVGSRRELRRALLRDLLGLTGLRQYLGIVTRGRSVPSASSVTVGWFGLLAAVHGPGFAATIWAGRWEIYPLYFGSLLTLYPLVNRIRLYGQHAAIDDNGRGFLAGSDVSRTIFGNALEKLLLNSPVMMYHHQHHVWPHLPWRALRQVAKPSPDPNVDTRSCLVPLHALVRGLS